MDFEGLPFISKTSGAQIVSGRINPTHQLKLESHMPAGGVIFSDGLLTDNIEFKAGPEATINLAERRTRFVRA